MRKCSDRQNPKPKVSSANPPVVRMPPPRSPSTTLSLTTKPPHHAISQVRRTTRRKDPRCRKRVSANHSRSGGRQRDWSHHGALGNRSIKSIDRADDMADLHRLFPAAPKAAAAAFIRPHGSVNLLIGMKSRELHCKGRFSQGSLTLCRTIFKQQWVLTGQSPARETTPEEGLPEGANANQDCTVPRRFKDATSKREHNHHPRNHLRGRKSRCKEDHNSYTTSEH